MNSIDFSIVFADAWPMIVGGSVGTAIAFAIRYHSQTASQVRKQIGASIDQYTDIPTDELNSALVLSAADARSGLSAMIRIVSIIVIMLVAGLSVQVYRQLFPDFPRWHSYCIAGLVASLFAWPMHFLERRSVLSKLNLRLANRKGEQHLLSRNPVTSIGHKCPESKHRATNRKASKKPSHSK